MEEFPQSLRQRLARMRLLPGGAVAGSGVGERRSRSKGDGLEFEDYRPYQVGDDLRRVDPRVFARLGEHYVRQYNVSQQLAVTIILDASRSMAFGEPEKLAFAAAIAYGLSFAALSGSDAIKIGVLHQGRMHWRPWQTGVGRIGEIEAWLAQWSGEGDTDLMAAVSSAREHLRPNGLTIIVSDFWDESAKSCFDQLAASSQSVVAVLVLSQQEWKPSMDSADSYLLVDMESGEEVAVTVGPEQAARYQQHLLAHVSELKSRVLAVGGRFTQLSTDDRLEDVFIRDLPASRVLL